MPGLAQWVDDCRELVGVVVGGNNAPAPGGVGRRTCGSLDPAETAEGGKRQVSTRNLTPRTFPSLGSPTGRRSHRAAPRSLHISPRSCPAERNMPTDRTPRILIVDDEDQIRGFLERAARKGLRDCGGRRRYEGRDSRSNTLGLTSRRLRRPARPRGGHAKAAGGRVHARHRLAKVRNAAYTQIERRRDLFHGPKTTNSTRLL